MPYEAKYIGPDLAELFGSGPAESASRRMANTGGDQLHARIAENTPVRTGNLRTAWYRVPTVREDSRYVAYVRNDVDYAPYVEYGTGLYGPEHRKYLIEPHPPKRFLSWIDPVTGERAYAHHVWHTGSKGAAMMKYGRAIVEAELEAIMQPALEVFAKEMEALAAKAQARVRVG